MKLGQKSASIIILSFFCTIYAPPFPKRGVSLCRTNALGYAVTTSFADFQVANIDNLK
jgi:hypothetical protein